MTQDTSPDVAASPPKIAFISLGCPKALTDSELILTQLSAEGYATSKQYAGADLVVVNTCGFIDEAVQASLGTIGEAPAAHRRDIVPRCPGAKCGHDGVDTRAPQQPQEPAGAGTAARR